VHNILNVLRPGSLGLSYNWDTMTDVRSSADETINDADCFHIIGTTKTPEDTELWIEKTSFIIRRMEETIVITEELGAKISSERQSVKNIETLTAALKKAGISNDRIEQTLTHLAKDVTLSTYRHIYDYQTVTVNQAVDASLFNS
jgi:hypothetical protein